MFGKIEFLFIFLIIIGISAFVGINIIRVFEKKMNNMKINIPQINVPKPKITVVLKTDKGNCNVSCIQQSSKDSDINEPTNLPDESSKKIINEPTKKIINEPTKNIINEPTKNIINEPTKNTLSDKSDDMNEIKKIISKSKNYYDEDDVLTDTISRVYKNVNSIKAFNETDYAYQ